jgi:hypothetical protein
MSGIQPIASEEKLNSKNELSCYIYYPYGVIINMKGQQPKVNILDSNLNGVAE